MRLLVAIALAAGCYGPHPHAGAPCANGACPDGLVCSPATNTCETTAIDAAHDTADSPVPHDAPPADTVPIDGPPPGPMLVQQKAGQANGGTASVTLPALPKPGNALVMIGGNPAGGLSTVTGGGVQTWVRIAASTAESNLEVWGGVSDGTSTTVTISLGANTSISTVWVGEWSGLDTMNAIDDLSTGSSQTAATIDPGAITTTHAHDVLLFGASAFTMETFGTPSSGPWIDLDDVTGGVSQAAWYRIVTTTGTYHPTLDHLDGGWDAALVAFRAAN